MTFPKSTPMATYCRKTCIRSIATGTLVKADGRIVGAVGLKDMIVVDTPDALLICPKDRAQDVKQLVTQLKEKERPETKLHTTVQKPWGNYTTLDERDGYLLKRIEVLAWRKPEPAITQNTAPNTGWWFPAKPRWNAMTKK